MANAVDRAVCAQGGAVVKPHQVKAMVLAARRAYKVQSDGSTTWWAPPRRIPSGP